MKVIAINGSPKAKGNTYHSLAIMREELVNHAKNMAWLMKMREATKESVEAPNSTKILCTNFIR